MRKYNKVFLVTYGRSGSTLLQGILNSNPDCTCLGENSNILYDFFQIHCKITAMKERWNGQDLFPTHSWFGASKYNEEILKSFLKEKFFNLAGIDEKNEQDKILGFKEIRFLEMEGGLHQYLNFVKELFPDCFFLFNLRDFETISNSAWWKHHDKAALKTKMSYFESSVLRYSMANDENTFVINFEDFTGNRRLLKTLFKKLEWEYVEATIDEVLDKNHSLGNTNVGDCVPSKAA